MKVTSSAITDGIIDPQYGKYGTEFNQNGVPTYSLPFKITDAPQGTVSFAIMLEDKDAFPISGGFSWIHWTAANITRTEIIANESQTAHDFVQGLTVYREALKIRPYLVITEEWHHRMPRIFMNCMCMPWIVSLI